MYDEWTEKSICAILSYHRLLVRHKEIERKLRIIEDIATNLIEEGGENFHSTKNFPKGSSHFSHMMHALTKVSAIKKEEAQ